MPDQKITVALQIAENTWEPKNRSELENFGLKSYEFGNVLKYILVNVTEWFLLFKPNSKPSQEIPGFIFDVNNYFKQKLTCSDLKSNRFAKVELLECGLICLFFVTVGICTRVANVVAHHDELLTQ